MIIDELFEAPQLCPECGGISFSDLILAEKKDACYHKVKASAKVWPSAYASGRLVQCRKKGAANYGNKSEGVAEGSLEEGVNDPHIFKAIAMIGPMGAGKSTIAQQLVGGSGLRSLNLDNFNELLIKQGKVAGGNLTPDQLERSWQLTQAQKGNWVDGRLGLLIDGSGRNVEGLVNPLMQLEALGYDTMVILVNVSLETSLQRQQSRAAQQAQQYGTGRNVPADLAKSSYDQIQQNIPKLQQLYGNKLLIINNEGTVDLEQEKTIVDRFLSAPPSKPAAVEWIKSQGASQGQQLDKRLAQQQRQQSSAQRAPTYKQQDVAETRRGQIPMTLKPGETDDLEPEDFEGLKQLPEYLEGQKAQQKAGKDLIQQSPYTYQSDQDWAYRNGAFDARQAASSADFTKRGPLTTEQGMAEAKRKKKSSRKSGGYFFPGYGYYGGGESGEGGGDGGESANPGMAEISIPKKYREKAQVSQAMAQANRFLGRDDPATVAAADRTIAKRERGLARADARRKPYTPPPVDMEKQRQQLTDKYPNIDELVRRAEVNRDPNYEYADGQAYYDGQEAEQKYQRLKQIQRIIQGLNEETRQATLNTPAGTFTANITKDKSTNTVSGTMPVGGATLSAKKDLTPGRAQSVTVDTDVAPNLNLSATRKSADYNKGQLAGTKSVAAKYTDTTGALGKPGQQHTATRTAGVGFGGASGARVGKNYVTQIDKTLADYMDEANIRRDPLDLPPLEGPMSSGMGGGGGYTGGSPFKGWFGGAKPGSREASVAQNNPNTMTVRQGPNPDYRPQTTGDKPKLNVKPGETMDQAVQRTKTQQEFGKFLQGQSGQTFGAGGGRGGQGGPTAAQANTMSNAPVSVKNQPSAINSMVRDLTNPPKSTNTNTTTTNNSPRQNSRSDTLDRPGPIGLNPDIGAARPGYDGRLGSNPGPNTTDKKSSFLGKTAKGLGYAAGAYGAADIGSRAYDYYDVDPRVQNYFDQIKNMSGVKEAKKQPPEEKYGPEYDDMVARVRKLAGLGPMKTVYDPAKRQYRNMPTAQQPKK